MSGGLTLEVIESGSSVQVQETIVYTVEVFDFRVASDVVPESIGTAKGSMIAYAASADPRELVAGGDGLVLTTDATQTLGVKWASPAGAGYNSLKNNTAGNLAKGASAVWDTSADSSFKTSTTDSDEAICGVLAENIDAGLTGRVATGGTIETGVLVTGNVSRGNWLVQSTTAGRLKDSGSAIPISGCIGLALTAYSGGGLGTVTAYIWNVGRSATATSEGIVELATDAETITGTDTTRAVTPANIQAKVSSETAKGIVELATSAETITGTDNTRAVHPAGLAAKTASETASGIVELATAAETTTGTDATRAVSPDGLAGSNYGKRVVAIQVFTQILSVVTGDAVFSYFVIPTELNGMNLVAAHASVSTVSSSGTPTIQIARYRAGWVDMLSTRITIDANEYSSYTAATAPVVDGSYDDVATGDLIRVDVDVAGTGTKGLIVYLTFQTP